MRRLKADTSRVAWREPIVFNFKVFSSLCRQVYQAEKLYFPTNLNTWATAYAQVWSRAVNGKWWQETLKTGAWAAVGVAVSRGLKFGLSLERLYLRSIEVRSRAVGGGDLKVCL